MSYYNYNLFLRSFDYVSKLPIHSKKEVPSLDNGLVTFKLRVVSEYDVKILHGLYFISWLTGQRGFIKKLKFIYKYNKPVIQVQVISTVRGLALVNLFEYLLICYFDLLKDRLMDTKVSVDHKSFNFFIRDINFFYNVPNIFYNFSNMVEVTFFFKDFYLSKCFNRLFLSNYPTIYNFLKRK